MYPNRLMLYSKQQFASDSIKTMSKFQDFTLTKHRFRTKYSQGTYF